MCIRRRACSRAPGGHLCWIARALAGVRARSYSPAASSLAGRTVA
jgi:hypothetical protein